MVLYTENMPINSPHPPSSSYSSWSSFLGLFLISLLIYTLQGEITSSSALALQHGILPQLWDRLHTSPSIPTSLCYDPEHPDEIAAAQTLAPPGVREGTDKHKTEQSSRITALLQNIMSSKFKKKYIYLKKERK